VADDWDVVVVGAGTAGCALAARLADAGRRVLVLEAGPAQDAVPDLHDPHRLPGGVPGHPAVEDLAVELTDDRRVALQRGRVVGGSSAVNAGVFQRGRPEDHDAWAAAGSPLWSYAAVLPAYRRVENDREFGDEQVHGNDGPVAVERPAVRHPVADAFGAATEELGFPAEPDKNAGGPPGHGPVPLALADGVRVDSATAYLAPRRLTVRSGVRVHRVVFAGGRAVGVQTADGTVRAAEVVLSAGAVGSAHLLLLSGVGPPDQLRQAGIAVVADLPVGAASSDHPMVYLEWRPARRLADADLPLSGVLHTADLEVLPWLVPFSRLTGGTGDDFAVGVAVLRPESRGTLTLRDGDPTAPPRLRYRYLTAEADRRLLRDGVRLAADLLGTRAFAALGPERTDLPDDVLTSDDSLDGWIRERLTTAVHLSGTAPIGTVVDPELRVRGIDGLRVVDTSVLPCVPSRGTAATAWMVGERAAQLMTGG
jgi:predicted dehydrogenase (TIGR03970 family)